MDAIYEIYLCDALGIRIECLDYITEFEYTKVVDAPGPFRLKLPFKFDRKNIKLDNIIEIWRGFGPGTLKLDYCGFLRNWVFLNEGGIESTELSGFSTLELLKRRIVNNYSGTEETNKTDEADDMMKEIVREQLGADASGDRNITDVGGGFTVQENNSHGSLITKSFSYKNLYDVCEEIHAATSQLGNSTHYDIVPIVSGNPTGALGFQFRTFMNIRGADRTWDSSSPIYIGPEWGNLDNCYLEYDYIDEVNYVTVLGQGEGSSQETLDITALSARDLIRAEASIWNRREGTKNAQNVEYGDTDGLTSEANAYLDENRPKIKFVGNIIETPTFRYGIDWQWGDSCTIVYSNIQLDCGIFIVHVLKSSDGEQITAKVQVEE